MQLRDACANCPAQLFDAAALHFGADAHGLLRGRAQFKTQPTMILKTTIPVSQAKAPMVRPTRAVTA